MGNIAYLSAIFRGESVMNSEMNSKPNYKLILYICITLLSTTAIQACYQANAWSFASGPYGSYYYDWVYYNTQTVASWQEVTGQPAYTQYAIRPGVPGEIIVENTVSTSLSVGLGVEFGVSITAEATVKQLPAKATAQSTKSLSISSSATITTTRSTTYGFSISHTCKDRAAFSAYMYTLTVSVYARHYYLHKLVWDSRRGTYYDTGLTKEQKPYHMVEYWLYVHDIDEDPTLYIGVSIDQKLPDGSYKYPDAVNIYQAIVTEYKYITETRERVMGAPLGSQHPFEAITDGHSCDYSGSVSFTVETSLGAGIEIPDTFELTVTVKYTTTATVSVSETVSEENTTRFEYAGDCEQAIKFHVLAWNCAWVEPAT